MDELDEFLAELESSAVISPTGPAHPNPDTNTSIEKELYDIFGDIASDTPVATGNFISNGVPMEKDESTAAQVPSKSVFQKSEEFDVLTWLDSPSKNIMTKDISPTTSGKNKSSPLLTSKQIAKLDLKTPSIDSFFDEVFGIDTTKNTVSSPRTPRCIMKDFDKAVKAIINSTFPDISKLKSMIIDAGYIPHSLRGAVWSLLLTGSITEDEEIKTYRPSEFALNNQHKILSDCEAIVTRYNSKNSSSITTDMYDVLILFCLRKEIEYMPLYCDLLAPFFLGNEGNSLLLSRSLASTCFYSFVNKCVPFINLSVEAMELSITTVHFWLRLLLIYHNPVIAQHLDRVVPGWEQPSRGFSASEASSKINQVKISDGLDELEKELGLGFNTSSSDSGHVHVQSARPSAASNACVPIHWVCGFFCSSLPPEQASYIIDWILLTQDRYAGIYLTIALFEIFASQLICMNNSKIKEWFENIASSQENWYQACAPSFDSSVDDLTFTDFTRGWIYAATRVMRTTPISFRIALDKTEEWAASTLTHQFMPAEFVDSNIPMVNDDQSSVSHGNDFDIDDILPADSATGNNTNTAPVIKSSMSSVATGQSLLDGIKRLGIPFPVTTVSSTNTVNDSYHDNHSRRLQCPHDSKTEANTMVLWTEVGEVIPCICTNKLRPFIQGDILANFKQGLSVIKNNESSVPVRGDDAMCFPLPQQPNEKPFYFGIDCRSDTERELGLFPKAFTVDPSTITDTEAVSHLLLTLEPLVNSVHLCVIGAGEGYIRHIHRNQSPDNLKRIVADHSAKLHAVAMFFLKKGFKYVSILDGGFYAACEYLHRSDVELTVTSALIDPDVAALDALFTDSAGSQPTNNANSTALNAFVSNISTATSSITSNVSEAVGSLLLKLSEPTTPPRSATATAATSSLSDNNDSAGTTSKLFSDFGRRVSLLGANSFESLKKTITNVNIGAASTAAPASSTSTKPNPLSASVKKDYSNAFVIDDEEDEDDRDDNKITISKTDQEKQRALAIHKVAGLRRGDQITIARDCLPGALLYPATKCIVEGTVPHDSEALDEKKEESPNDRANKPLHRYLVVTKERFLILDSGGKGVGTVATVKANHHLTELLKMTFRKKDPELITLYFLNNQGVDQDPVTKMFRVTKRKEFVETLQRNMQYFK